MNVSKSVLVATACLFAGTLSAATIVNSVDELSFSYSNGASESSSGGGTLVVNTSKNSFATAALPDSYLLGNIGDTMSVTFDMTLDNVMADTVSTLLLSFGSTHDFQSSLKISDTVQSIVFSETGDPNLGKYSSDMVLGTSTHTLTFGLERTGADEMSLSFASPTLSSTTRTVTNDVIPVGTFTFDTFYFNFRGDGWNETFPTEEIKASFSNFTIDTTGSVIPEPSSLALIGLALGGIYLLRRRR